MCSSNEVKRRRLRRKHAMFFNMKISAYEENRRANLEFTFSTMSGSITTKTVVFNNILLNAKMQDKLLSSNFLEKANFKKDPVYPLEPSSLSFNIKVYTKKDLENEKFDRNNDPAYLFYKDFLLTKIAKDNEKFIDLSSLIQNEDIG